MDLAAAHTIIFPFYEALTKPSSKNVAALIASCAAPDWRSFAGPTQSKGRDEFIAQVQGFGMLIPRSELDHHRGSDRREPHRGP